MAQVHELTNTTERRQAFFYAPWSAKYTFAIVALAVTSIVLVRTGAQARSDVEDRIDGAYAITSLGLAATMSAEHHDGLLPPVHDEEPILMPDPDFGHPGYLVDGRVTAMKVDKDAAILLSYLDGYRAFTMHHIIETPGIYYLGHAVTNEAEGLTLLRVYRERLERGESLEGDIPVPAGSGTAGSDTLYALRTDLPEVLEEDGIDVADDFATQVPWFIEHPGNYELPGGWVVPLQRQGIRFMAYPGEFPMTENFITALETLRKDFSSPPSDE